MKVKTQERYLDKEWIEMGARLKAFMETGDQEQLHKFRVQVKKLRAMLLLFQTASEQPSLLKDFKPVKKIFRRAGIIRDAHIRLGLAEHFNLKNERFETSQRQIIAGGIKEFADTGDLFLKELKAVHRKMNDALRRIENDRIVEFYEGVLEKISEGFNAISFGEEMHTNRKLIKLLIYNYKVAAEALEGKLTIAIDYLDRLQEAIGKWHDNLIAEELFSTPELSDKSVINKLKKANAALKRNIKKMAKDFLEKATKLQLT